MPLLLIIFHALCTDSAVESSGGEGEKDADGHVRNVRESGVPSSDGGPPFVPYLPELSKRFIT